MNQSPTNERPTREGSPANGTHSSLTSVRSRPGGSVIPCSPHCHHGARNGVAGQLPLPGRGDQIRDGWVAVEGQRARAPGRDRLRVEDGGGGLLSLPHPVPALTHRGYVAVN